MCEAVISVRAQGNNYQGPCDLYKIAHSIMEGVRGGVGHFCRFLEVSFLLCRCKALDFYLTVLISLTAIPSNAESLLFWLI